MEIFQRGPGAATKSQKPMQKVLKIRYMQVATSLFHACLTHSGAITIIKRIRM